MSVADQIHRLATHATAIATNITTRVLEDPYLRGRGLTPLLDDQPFEVPGKGVVAWPVVRGGEIPHSRLSGERVQLPAAHVGVAVDVPADIAGLPDTPLKLADEGAWAMRLELARQIQKVERVAGSNTSLLVAAIWPGLREVKVASGEADEPIVFQLTVPVRVVKL